MTDDRRPRRELCESAKKGRVCPDDICHGGDVTLCGFDKEEYEEMSRDYFASDDIEEYDDRDDD